MLLQPLGVNYMNTTLERPKGSLSPDLFAETPNYRLFGKKVIGGWGEKFRWHIGANVLPRET